MNKSQWSRYWTLARTRNTDMTQAQANSVMHPNALTARVVYLHRDDPDPLITRHELRRHYPLLNR